MPATRSSPRRRARDPVFDRAPARVPLAAAAGGAARRSVGLGRRGARRIRATVAGAGIHARHHRRAGADSAPAAYAQRSATASCSSSKASTTRRSSTSCRFGCTPSDPYIAGIRIDESGDRRRAHRLRSQERDAAAALRAPARRHVRASRRARSLSADAGRSADGAARGKARADGDAKPPARAGRSALAKSRPRSKRTDRRKIIVALDPGHGGEDPGAIGQRGTYEKNVVLAIARKLKALLDAEPGMRAMLTRDDDYYVPLATRVKKAQAVQADLFVSIHADAFRERSARGSSVFALSRTAARPAPRRNGSRRRRTRRT